MTTTRTHSPEAKEATVDTFPLPSGTALPQGIIVDLTLTAYKVVGADGRHTFVPFITVHQPVPATPLVEFI